MTKSSEGAGCKVCAWAFRNRKASDGKSTTSYEKYTVAGSSLHFCNSKRDARMQRHIDALKLFR
eukprot:12890837-Prorocentrum_lima.AAC.1